MPVYLCQPGEGSAEPWRYGIQVYAAPFPIEDSVDDAKARTTDWSPRTPKLSKPKGNIDNDIDIDNHAVPHEKDESSAREQPKWQDRERRFKEEDHSLGARPVTVADEVRTRQDEERSQRSRTLDKVGGVAIRRVRHAEVLLIDDVCLAFDRYWLRLRWPGRKGEFAGYIDWGKREGDLSDPEAKNIEGKSVTFTNSNLCITEESGDPPSKECPEQLTQINAEGHEHAKSQVEHFVNNDNASSSKSKPNHIESSAIYCLRTGIAFPSSAAMRLLHSYDDGLNPSVSTAPPLSEPVFCRICREGLHDDADDQQPSPVMENEIEGKAGKMTDGDGAFSSGSATNFDSIPKSGPMQSRTTGPITPHPTFQQNSCADNPILAPCECSGSMAFVHYLCVEQWRCRSRHPKARNGLNCETCGGAYALPLPSTRPGSAPVSENDDWMDAMPPHVLAALRHPHFFWRIGTYVTQQRWLRPITPVVMSPLVALYCRARRLLKKKGVARRRWACSLCRRRARWKCVRCLRSYYCSRHCQNVAWHIVHKHVCYRPARWWSSTLVYSTATLVLFPGILRDPFMHDIGLGVIPVSFYVAAVLSGGIATFLKRSARLDLRSRTYEIFVICFTLGLIYVKWGLIGGFFGETSKCRGIFGELSFPNHGASPVVLHVLHRVLLSPAQTWFKYLDNLVFRGGSWVRGALCTPQADGCFTHMPHANAHFILVGDNSGFCASDALTISCTWIAAGIVALINNIWTRRERRRRAEHRARREERPHQD